MHWFLKFILGMKLYIFRTVSLSIIRCFSLYTQQWYMSYRSADSLLAGSGWNILILLASCQQTCMTHTIVVCAVKNSWRWTEELSETACEQDQDVPSWSCSQAVSKPVWHILSLCVQWKTPDDGQRNCSKHVDFHSKNKFEKLVHLVGFIIGNLTRCTVTWTLKTRNLWPFLVKLMGPGCSVLILSASCQQTCMTYTFAVCTVKNSWWWTEELPETCRFSFQE